MAVGTIADNIFSIIDKIEDAVDKQIILAYANRLEVEVDRLNEIVDRLTAVIDNNKNKEEWTNGNS